MSASFEFAIAFTLHQEGGYTPGLVNDPGGETHWGISKRSYPDLDIKNLSREQAISIYRRDYWDALHLDQLPPPLATMLFEGAVNQGAPTARGFIRDLQRMVRVNPDGIIGPATASACAAHPVARLLRRICVVRAIRYTEAANFQTYGGAWIDRLFKCFDYCAGLPA